MIPSECEHVGALLVQESRTSGEGIQTDSHEVLLCPHCGLFIVHGRKGGEAFKITFGLGTEALVHAAGACLERQG
jgi:hypothetical protein